MCSLLAALARASLVWLTLLASVEQGFSDDHPASDGSRNDPRQEWLNLAQGQTEFEVSDFAQVPSSLRLAAERSRCRYKEGIQVAPVHLLRAANRLLAIVTCWGPFKSHQEVFDLSDRQAPRNLPFPIVALPNGFTTSITAPGIVVWERKTGLFQATTTSDLIPASHRRYTYRLDAGAGGFVVLRVEDQHGSTDWKTIWEAPRWTDLAKPN